jgi:membrane protein DedA with SNARE-associated domain
LSFTGTLAATALGFVLGRRSRRVVARLVPAEERARAEELLMRYGPHAIVASRPVPMLAESTVIVAGAGGLAWSRVLVAGALGALPPALLYALAGAAASRAGKQALVFLAVLVLAALLWLVGRRVQAAPPLSSGD